MNMLEEWQQKKSWLNQFIMCPYYIDEDLNVDIDLAALIKKQDEPKVNLNVETGFEGIYYVMEPDQNYQFGNVVTYIRNVKQLVNHLIYVLETYLLKCWDPNVFHLVFCSGGTDSRILSLILSRLQDDGMELGELMFLCHSEEIPIFKKAMQDQDWENYEWHCYKEKEMLKPDYYDWGNFSHNMNGFLSPRVDFYSDILKEINSFTTKDVCLVTGVVNDVLFMYPSTPGLSKDHRGYQELDLDIFKGFTQYYKPYYLTNYANWKDVLYPFLNYEYLDICFQIPKELFVRKKTKLTGDRDIDIIRLEMLKQLENTVPVSNKPANYNMKFSQTTRDYIQFNWEASKLYDDFPEIRSFDPSMAMPDQNRVSTKFYGLATCYEVAKQ